MMDDHDFRELLEYLQRPWQGYRKVRKGVIKRLRRHMTDLGCATLGCYLAVLEEDRSAYQMCQAHLRVTISRFCRDRQVWQHLENRLLPDLAARFPQGLRVWSAGCARGEEPYSLAMLWDRLHLSPALEIIATDADPRLLDRARQGVFGKSSLKELPREWIFSCFHKADSQHYTILPHLRENIGWYRHDLLELPPSGPFHLILLRNSLLTYYQQPALGPAVERIVEMLAPGGLFIIGAHEKLPDLSLPLLRDPSCPLIFHRLLS